MTALKRALLTLSALFLPVSLCCADSLDALCEQISQCLDDATRLDEGRLLLEQAFALPDVKDDSLYHQLLYLQSYYYINSGDFASAKQQLLSLLYMLPSQTAPELSISVPQDLAICYRREAKNDSALYYYDIALQAALQQEDLEWQAAISLNIGILHFNTNHIQEAEQFLDHAISLVRQIDDPYTELCALQVGAATKVRLGKNEEARQLVEPAYALALQSESPDWQLRCLTTMTKLYDQLGLTDSVTTTLQRGDALLPLLPPHGITAIGYVTARGNYHFAHRQWQHAATDLQSVMESEMSGFHTYEGYNDLAVCYEQLGQWQRAYQYKDSALRVSRREAEQQFEAQMAEFNARYHSIEKDQEINRLQTQRNRTIIIVTAAAVLLTLLLLGLWLVARQRRQRREAQLRIEALEQERRRIARELHDGLCNNLLVLEMQCASGFPPDDTAAHLGQLRQQARRLSHQLMPPEFAHLSLPELLHLLAQEVSSNNTVKVSFGCSAKTDTAMLQLAPQTAHELYRIVQEHTANIVKGRTATSIAITLEEGMLTITDNGQKTDADSQGIGHRTLHDRAAAMGATVSAYTTNGINTLRIAF